MEILKRNVKISSLIFLNWQTTIILSDLILNYTWRAPMNVFFQVILVRHINFVTHAIQISNAMLIRCMFDFYFTCKTSSCFSDGNHMSQNITNKRIYFINERPWTGLMTRIWAFLVVQAVMADLIFVFFFYMIRECSNEDELKWLIHPDKVIQNKRLSDILVLNNYKNIWLTFGCNPATDKVNFRW